MSKRDNEMNELISNKIAIESQKREL
jgi:hypothetical protein